jgi:hypothetical protein
MSNQITLEEALKLVEFKEGCPGHWYVAAVKGDCGVVEGNCKTVKGYCGTVEGDCGIVKGEVCQTINGRQWQYVETPKEKLKRLIEAEADHEQLLEAFNEMEDN